MKRGRVMRKLTTLQIDTLTKLYYGEVYVRHSSVRLKSGRTVLVQDIIDLDDIRLTSRCVSLFRRKLIRWCNHQDYEVVVLTNAGIKEMEAIDA